MNALDSEWGVNDLEAVVRGGADVVRLPKTDTAQDVIDIENEILRIENACGREPGSTGLLAAVESPLGITRAVEIAHASERLIGIALGAEDYVRNLRTERSPEGTELLFARCAILQAARSAGIQAFDTVYSDANNEAGFLQEAAHIKQLGFDGKSLINPARSNCCTTFMRRRVKRSPMRVWSLKPQKPPPAKVSASFPLTARWSTAR